MLEDKTAPGIANPLASRKFYDKITRDMALSAVLRTDELLTQAGVATELHVWEGMWHSFFSDPELPESKAAYAVMANFFERRLGSRDR